MDEATIVGTTFAGMVAMAIWLIQRNINKIDEAQKETIRILQKELTDGLNSKAISIKHLYELHCDDKEQLTALRLEIANNHYPKPEVDKRFEQLTIVISNGFTELGNTIKENNKDIKEISKALHQHLIHGHNENKGQ